MRVTSLVSGATQRAERTLSFLDDSGISGTDEEDDSGRPIPSSVSSLLSGATSRADQILSSPSRNGLSSATTARMKDQRLSWSQDRFDVVSSEELAEEVSSGYGENPTITSTALAHSLWWFVLRPGVDSAIDATCGNGGDSTVLAKMLFGSSGANIPVIERSCQLLCLDVSQDACRNTTRELGELRLAQNVLDNHVQVLRQSHTPLPLPRNASSVGLVAYNLGFLPKLKHRSRTETDTTLASLGDAALALRVGGLLSVMTYPRTNREEDAVVRAFLQGVALFSSVTSDYQTFVQQLDEVYFFPDSKEEEDSGNTVVDRRERTVELRRLLLDTLGRVMEGEGSKQTWRVFEHRKIGWTDAPILVTATRIK